MSYCILSHRGLIRISGDDAYDFLQGLISNDVRLLKEGKALYAALLSPQGKFLHDFFLVSYGDSTLLDCDKARLDDLLKRLGMYKLRSKVSMEMMGDEVSVAAIWYEKCIPENKGADVTVFADPRWGQLGWRTIGNREAVTTLCKDMEQSGEKEYERMRIGLGVPDGAQDMTADKSLLLEFGFEDLHGVDFKKGCYVGQEVTARSKYRGQLKKFVYQVHSDIELPEPGTPVTLAGANAGELRSHADAKGLALLRIAEVEKAQASGMELQCGNAMLKPVLPGWVMHAPKALAMDE